VFFVRERAAKFDCVMHLFLAPLRGTFRAQWLPPETNPIRTTTRSLSLGRSVEYDSSFELKLPRSAWGGVSYGPRSQVKENLSVAIEAARVAAARQWTRLSVVTAGLPAWARLHGPTSSATELKTRVHFFTGPTAAPLLANQGRSYCHLNHNLHRSKQGAGLIRP